MWIVQVALRRPYTFLVMALLILLATPLVLLKMPTDIFPEINIPVISIVFQPNANIPTAIAQVVSQEQSSLRQLPPGILPPLVIKYSASSIPVIQLGLSSPTLSEQALFDAAANFLRPRL